LVPLKWRASAFLKGSKGRAANPPFRFDAASGAIVFQKPPGCDTEPASHGDDGFDARFSDPSDGSRWSGEGGRFSRAISPGVRFRRGGPGISVADHLWSPPKPGQPVAPLAIFD